jgi:hypothetical protein
VFASAPTAVPQIQGGKLRGLAVTGVKREPSLPDVPTMAEQGFEKYQATNWYGFIAPARTPADIIIKLTRAIVASLHDAPTLERLNHTAMTADPTTPQEMRDFVTQEYETWGKVVRTLKF